MENTTDPSGFFSVFYEKISEHFSEGEKTMGQFRGVYPPIITPFDSNGKINEPVYRKVVDFLIGAGVQGFWTCGGSGEGVLMSDDELKQMADLTVDAVKKRVKIIFHVGGPTTRRAVEAAKYAAAAGVDAICSVPPYFYGTDDASVVAHLQAIGAATDLPLFFYNLPQSTGVLITPKLMDKLVEAIPTAAGIKHSHPDLGFLRYFAEMNNGQLDVFVGNLHLFLPALTLGACGCISTPLWPKHYVAVWESFQQGDIQAARKHQQALTKIHEPFLDGEYPWFGTMKFILSKTLGIDCGEPRMPNLPLTKEQKESVRKRLQEVQM
jgi:dihydrodipicolinate synthase/N-acetylneuraminate lyase